MAIVVVGGSRRGVGKTALVCGLIGALPEFRWTAVKITNHLHGRAEHLWEEVTAGNGSDTARYLAAGAQRALLATVSLDAPAPQRDFALLLAGLKAKLEPGANIILESNRVLEYLQPDLCLMVRAGADRTVEGPAKPSFSLAARRAQAVVEQAGADRMLRGGPESKPVFQLADLERVSPEMRTWLLLKLALLP